MIKKSKTSSPAREQKSKIKKAITKDMNLGEVARTYPEAAKIMLEYGLHCVGCWANAFDTIEAGMKLHGWQAKDINDMIKKINKII